MLYSSYDRYSAAIKNYLIRKAKIDTLTNRLKVAMPNVKPIIASKLATAKTSLGKDPRKITVDIPVKQRYSFANSSFNPSSRFIRHIKYMPLSNTISLRLNNRSYPYMCTPKVFENFCKAISLGRFYNSKFKH